MNFFKILEIFLFVDFCLSSYLSFNIGRFVFIILYTCCQYNAYIYTYTYIVLLKDFQTKKTTSFRNLSLQQSSAKKCEYQSTKSSTFLGHQIRLCSFSLKIWKPFIDIDIYIYIKEGFQRKLYLSIGVFKKVSYYMDDSCM